MLASVRRLLIAQRILEADMTRIVAIDVARECSLLAATSDAIPELFVLAKNDDELEVEISSCIRMIYRAKYGLDVKAMPYCGDLAKWTIEGV